MRILLLVNPVAASVTARSRVAVEDVLAADHDLTVAVTAGKDHATDLARQAADGGVDMVAVLAGDGTLNEAANGLVRRSTALGPLPGGSTNVFARTIGLTNEPRKAAVELAAALSRGSRRRIEMGTAGGRYFLFHVGMGLDAAVVEQVERHGPRIKRRLGQAPYVYAAVSNVLGGYGRRGPRLAVRVGDDGTEDHGGFVLCLKTNPYTFFGKWPLDVAPEAGLGRSLATVTFGDLRPVALQQALISAIRDGRRLQELPHVAVRAGVEAATVSSDAPFPYQMDGEYLGRLQRLELSYEPDCLTLVLP
jgi:diacylglycerol kinase family enzyme